MANDVRVLVLFSGRGSNFENLARHQGAYRIVAAISDNPQAGGIKIAQDFTIPVTCVARADYASRALQKQEILRVAQMAKPDLICLAGFMQIISPEFLGAFPDRVINIHPSLLPLFPGLDTHARALSAGASTHGCTVHLVDAGVDTGAIIAQAQVPVRQEMSPEELAALVLKEEHKIYPWVVNQLAHREIQLIKGTVHLTASARAAATSLGLVLPTKQ